MMMIKAPSESVDGPIENVLQELHSRLHCVTDGSIFSYIPELARAQPEWFGLSIATLDGHIYGVGDWDLPFTIQSVSKPFVYALAVRIRKGLSTFAARDLDVDTGVFTSEQTTGDRNRAIAYLIRTLGLLNEDVEALLDVYFRQCSILVTIPAGQAFGEVAPTLCHVLSVHGFKALGANHPDIALVLFQAIARSLSSRLRHANREIRGLAD